ncbi:MAG: hypothetical protein LBV00_08040 [Propionibacteriaceae bacterium]|jgi:hypothetical protein|nr:hypothetical protein [Propionibacteriaceae bacterium]
MRHIELKERDRRLYIRKASMSPGEASLEARVIDLLRDSPGVLTPEVVSCEDSAIELTYVPGSRLFNVFVELDQLPPALAEAGQSAKRNLLARAEAAQKTIQQALYEERNSLTTRPYPFSSKTGDVLLLLTEVLGLDFEMSRLEMELRKLEDLWDGLVLTPFRDAAPKNMLLADERLWLHSYEDEPARSEFFRSEFRKSAPEVPDWISAPLVDFDFGSCCDLTTPEDDMISLLAHERTWTQTAVERIRSETWLDSIPPDGFRFAVSLLVRFGRFGGRKAAYQLVHPSASRTRFRYDMPSHYFQRAGSLALEASESLADLCPLTLELFDMIGARIGAMQPTVDYFRQYENPERRTHYVDLFPD